MPSRISQMRNEQWPTQPSQMNQSQQSPINEAYLAQIKALMKSKNAAQYLNELASINPQFKQFMDIAKNGNIQKVYEMLAHQNNVDPEWLIKYLIS